MGAQCSCIAAGVQRTTSPVTWDVISTENSFQSPGGGRESTILSRAQRVARRQMIRRNTAIGVPTSEACPMFLWANLLRDYLPTARVCTSAHARTTAKPPNARMIPASTRILVTGMVSSIR